jgi:hypothetical protein
VSPQLHRPLPHLDWLEARDRRAAELRERLVVRSVEDSIREGKVVLSHPLEPRNKHQSVTLLDAIAELGLDACIGGRSCGASTTRVGDITCTAPVESTAATVEEIVAETAATTITERDAPRRPDLRGLDGAAQGAARSGGW